MAGRHSRGRDVERAAAAHPPPQVFPGSPADKGGLREGDVVVEIDGREVVTTRQLLEAMGKDVGRRLSIKVLRSGIKDAVSCVVVTEDESDGAAEAAEAGRAGAWGRGG